MDGMPKPRFPFVRRETTRHGKPVFYFRRGDGLRLRMPEPFGGKAFILAYGDALAGTATPTKKNDKASFRWLDDAYRRSAAWAELAPATRQGRETILRAACVKIGAEPFSSITRRDIVASVDARAKTPFAAKNFLKTMRGLFAWAKMAQHVTTDPTEGISVTAKETGGFATWTDDDMRRFETRWPLGTRERVAYEIFRCTGLRRGDAAKFGRQHVRAGLAALTTEKTKTPVYVPILPELRAALDAGPVGEMVFIAGDRGRPMTKESLGNWFREACDAAGVKKSAHGLRKAAAVRLAEAGATTDQLDAIFGWEGGKMAAHYTKAASRRRLAEAGMAKLGATDQEQEPPHPPKGAALDIKKQN